MNTYEGGSPTFWVQEFSRLFAELDGWIRSRLRSMQLKKWKNPRKFQRMLNRSDYKGREANQVWVKMNKWQSVNRREARCIMNLQWFRRQRLTFLSDFIQRQLPLELKFSR